MKLTLKDVRELDFWKRVKVQNGCWIWKQTHFTESMAKDPGYGSYSIWGKPNMAHRVAVILVFGPIPEDLEIDHMCNIKNCVNPYHMRLVTTKENLRRSHLIRRRNKIEKIFNRVYDD